ncbi:serine hydrolase domain-containing protein [Pseudoalteromonas luteoviolacea]|uniref:serine hydrolase domain-containing protein n=1 Tax=Pseudoalteromonas luteoviolacea TaxID=43657 RepID=UPI001B3992AC|nr:serine hydrolase domain-containing protein [Pseudoalteromonas luteoviolacea]MBQ4839884.1 beta-lactamase family protein [Pseudoalteromonas luteoviolacea]
MKPKNLVLPGLICSLLAGCNDDNHAPNIEVAQPNHSAIVTTQLSLTAVVSDKDNNLQDIKWRQISGPAQATLEVDGNKDQSIEVTLPAKAGEYIFEIEANDIWRLKEKSRFIVTAQSLEEAVFPQLDKLLSDTYSESTELVPGMQALIDFGIEGQVWRGAVGYRDKDDRVPLLVDTPFRIASISKTLSAGVTFSLIDEGVITLDTTLAELVSESDMPKGYQVEDFHVLNGVKRGGAITVRQLLDQTSGIEDFVSYLSDLNAPDTRSFQAALLGTGEDIPAVWHSDLLIEDLLRRGITQSLDNMPGEQHLYGNSNTDILAWALEQYTGKSFEQLLYERVYLPLGMNNTYMDQHEPARGDDKIVEHYFNISDVEHVPPALHGNHNIVALGVNTSFAWAGGGLVSTIDDLNLYFTALHQRTLVQDPKLNEAIQSHWMPIFSGENMSQSYGLALAKYQMNGFTSVGHSGFWGVNAAMVEPLGIRVITANHQVVSDSLYDFEYGAIQLLHNLGIKGVTPLVSSK